MRVMCINDNWKPHPRSEGKPAPKFGDVNEVDKIIKDDGYDWYTLKGYEPNQG